VAGVLPELGKDEHRVAAILFREWQSSDFELKLRREILNSLLKTINRLRQQSDPHAPPLLFDSFLETFRSGLKLATVEQLYALSLDEFIKRCCQAFYGRLFFIFDQFEEYIYYHPLSEDGKHFDEQLAAAINDRSVPAGFLVSLREDGLGKLDRLRGGIPDLLGNVIRLEHLDKNGAEEALRKPLRIFNRDSPVKVEVTDDFTATLLNQADADRLEWDEPAPPYVVAALFQSLLFVHEKMGVVIGRAFERGRRFVPILVVKDQDALRARAHEQNAVSGLAEGQRLSRQEDHMLPVGNVDHRQQQVVGRHIQMAQQEIFHDGVILAIAPALAQGFGGGGETLLNPVIPLVPYEGDVLVDRRVDGGAFFRQRPVPEFFKTFRIGGQGATRLLVPHKALLPYKAVGP
jgi:hypothetical protein